MAQVIFERYEKKYLLTEEQYQELMLILNGVMDMDRYGLNTISNIYLDTPDYEMIRTSLEKPVYKEKIRLRCYGTDIDDSSPVFVEIKKKYASVVYKRRIEMSLETARKYLYYGIEPEVKGQIFNEVDYMIKRYGLRPAAYISYDRTAYTCQIDPELRVTFDRNIRGRLGELDLRVEPYGKCVLPRGCILMEIKIPGAMPVWFSRLLAEKKIFPVSYSKYGTFYEEYIHPVKMAEPLEESGDGRIYSNYTGGGVICA